VPFIDSTYLGAAYGSAQRDALCPSGTELAQVIAQAEANVEAALVVGGYTRRRSSSTVDLTPEVVKNACFGQWLRLAHGRNGLDLPSAYWESVNLLAMIRDGSLEIDGETKNATRAVGGVSFTNSSDTSDSGRPQIFSRSKMIGY
jgi:hypothetical protein